MAKRRPIVATAIVTACDLTSVAGPALADLRCLTKPGTFAAIWPNKAACPCCFNLDESQ